MFIVQHISLKVAALYSTETSVLTHWTASYNSTEHRNIDRLGFRGDTSMIRDSVEFVSSGIRM